jgi:hypothetical protein
MELIPGWSEGDNGILASADPIFGGIIDKAIVSGRWFVIFNDDSIPPTDLEFATRAEAIGHFIRAKGC